METSLLLAAAVNQSVYIIDLNGIVKHPGGIVQSNLEAEGGYHLQPRLLKNMIQKLDSYSSNVEAMEFSSNASALFVSANFGRIFMFSLSDIKSGSLTAFRQWSTGSLSPLSALYHIDFECDGITREYLIGGTNFNRELRMWRLPDCELIQTVRFCANEDHDAKETVVEIQKPSLQPMLITQFDPNSGLLLASDIKRTVLYALLLARGSDPLHELRFQCVCEFVLVSPCIAFDISNVERSHPFEQLFSGSKPTEGDNINVKLVLLHPKELEVGKLNFFVPLETYEQKDLSPFKVPLSLASGACSSPIIPEGDKSSDMFSRFLRRPNSETINPLHLEGSGVDRLSSPPPTKNPPSTGSITPQVSPGEELPETAVEVDENTTTLREEDSSLKKVFDSATCNMGSSLLSAHQLPLEASSSIVDPSRIPYLSFDGSDKQPVLSDSIRSLAGSSSVASLSNSLYRGSSNADLAGPPNDALSKAMGLSMNNVLNDSARSLDGNSVETDLTQFQPDPLLKSPVQQKPASGRAGFSLDLSGVSDGSEIVQLLKTILQQNREILSTVKTLTNKVQENKNNLSKLSTVQNTILKQLNVLATGPPGTVVAPAASSSNSSPPWANQILDQVRKQKAESAKQLTQLEAAVRNLQLPTGVSSGFMPARSPASPTAGAENRQLTEQIRNIVRSELHLLFQSNTPKIMAPLIQNLRGNLERILSPLPQTVADRMLTIIKEPNFLNYLGDHMSASLSPAVTEGYRKELRQTFVPGLNKVVDKLCKELNDLVQGALTQHIQTVTLRLESGVQNNCNKIDASAKKFDEQINRLSKDISAKLINGVKEILTKSLQQPQAEPQFSSIGGNSYAGTAPSPSSVGGQKDFLGRSLIAPSTSFPALNPFTSLTPNLKQQQQQQQQQQQLKIIPSGSADTYSTALTFIQSRQYAQALETPNPDRFEKSSPSMFKVGPAGLITLRLRVLRRWIPSASRNGGIAVLQKFTRLDRGTLRGHNALTSPDQSMLLKVLQNIATVPLFTQNIRQELLLSLLHQLSCGNLQEQFELKISFIQEALNRLRVNDPTIREMGDRILNSLQNKLSILLSSNKLNFAEENRAATLQRLLAEKRMSLNPILS
ncbi:hypothetical protein Aperf_G00000087509 [Anoplocephala perfoliata]